MKKIVSFFKNKIVISIIGLIILSLLIWYIGPQIKFGSDNSAPLGSAVARLVTIMVIIVLWGLNNLRIAIHDKKTNENLVSDLQQSQVGSSSVVSEQTSEEMHVIGERFNQALATLKRVKFRNNRSGRALYELPWYIIIGPPGSGKTTALVNSSLEFPLADKFGKEALHGIGGTRNCDWWFTNDAVLIDTAGRYTTQDSHKVIDSKSWDGFLGLLKKYRRRRPINGAIVAISLQELLTQTEDERINHARTIRARIDELMSKLEIRFPIYLVLTKSDLISGFSEYFEDLDKDAREQVWGVSLPNSPHSSQSPDFEYFEDEYNNLVKRLYERVISRIHQERDVNRRAAIQGFPQQMENLKGILLQFIKQTFVKNRYQYQPYLRGIYFTSGTQDGTPIDRLMTSVSNNFGFDRQLVSSGIGMGKSYFLSRLFREVIFPESELVGSNRKYERFMRWSQRAGVIGLTGVTAALLVIWVGSFTRNEMYMHQVEGYLSDYKAEQAHLNKWSTDIRTVLPSLDALSKASQVYRKEAHPWLTGLGMYDSSVDDAADKAYAYSLRNIFLPRLLKYMEYYLGGGQKDGSLYDNFRIYMMFEKVDHMDKAAVMNWFNKHWSTQFSNSPNIEGDLTRQLQALLQLNLKPAALNANLVAEVRENLSRIPVAQRIYNRLRSNPNYETKINLLDNFGESVRTTYVVNSTVQDNLDMPVLFTKQAYQSIDLSPKSKLISRLVQDNWVMSDAGNTNAALSDDDLKRISKQVKAYYTDEYSAYWQKVYRSLRVKPFDNLREANDALNDFVDPVYSPLLSILHVGARNTTLTNQSVSDMAEEDKTGAKGKALNYLSSHITLTPVDKEFHDLNRLTRASKENPAQIQDLMAKVRQLQEFVNGIVLAPDPGKKAFTIAKARYQGDSGNAITSLISYSQSLPSPVNRWMQTLASQTWKVILRSAHGYIGNQWHDQVYSPCQSALSDRYPISKNSTDDVAMLDFTTFFKPGGTIDKFTSKYIKPFVNVDSDWSNKGVGDYSLGLYSQALSEVKHSISIRHIFFRQNPSSPSLSFQLRPYNMDKTDERFRLEIGDTTIQYSHGPKFWSSLKWSGNSANNEIRLVFEDLSGKQYTASYEGPWAWFRLQDHSELQSTSDPNVYIIRFSVNDGVSAQRDGIKHFISYEIKANSIYNPFKRDVLDTFRCTDRI